MGEPASWVFGTISIVFAFIGSGYRRYLGPEYLAAIITSVVIGLLVHEYMHRLQGRKYGCHSEYVVTLWGVLVTILSGFLPFLILIPGYTSIRCYLGLGKEKNGVIAAVGPISNLFLAYIVLIVEYFIHVSFLEIFVKINLWLALFNLLPFYPLDGSKIMAWNTEVWGVLVILSSPVLFL